MDGRVLQSGFLVVNNTNGDFINVNFIDTSLDVVDKWGTTTMFQLLNSDSTTIPADYVAAIDEMKN